MDLFSTSMTSTGYQHVVKLFGCNDVGVAGEVESHPGVREPEATMGMWPPAAAEAVPPIGQLLHLDL